MNELMNGIENEANVNAVDLDAAWMDGFKTGLIIGVLPMVGYITYKKVIKPLKSVKKLFKKAADEDDINDDVINGDFTEVDN